MRASFVLAWSSRLLLTALVALSANAKETEIVSKITTPNLPFGDINVVILTDVHSWLGGHRRHEKYDADLGDVLSFWEQLNEQYSGDLFLVNNGDFVDGTGLSETIDGDNNPEFLIPLLEKMPYDAVNVGNHELYSPKNIRYMMRPGGYVDWWGDRYLTSNIHRVDDDDSKAAATAEQNPLGNRYKVLKGTHSNLLVFGFLYNMKDYAHGAGIEIENVQTTVQQQWFLDALEHEDYDAILVLAHMDLVDPLVDVLRSAIREQIGDDIAIVFATGHTHYRGSKQLEDHSLTFEAGKYMDTVGFVSLPRKDSIAQTKKHNETSVFGHVYLDASKKVLFEDTLGFENADDAKTKDGKDFSDFINRTRAKLGLDQEIGCAPRNYYVSRHVDAPGSMWGLYRDEVIPKLFGQDKAMKALEDKIVANNNYDNTDDDLPYAMLLPSGNWRYNLYNNATVVVDDVYAISPFNDTVLHMGIFSAETILEANRTLNHKRTGKLPSFVLVGDVVGGHLTKNKKHHLYAHEYAMGTLQHALEKASPSEKVTVTKSGFTSSLIWLAFVEKYWPCGEGTGGSLPEWFFELQQQQQQQQVEEELQEQQQTNAPLQQKYSSYDWMALVGVALMLMLGSSYDFFGRYKKDYKLISTTATAASRTEIPSGDDAKDC